VSVQKVLQCPFHCKVRPLGVTLESPGSENIPVVSGNGAEVSQNHDTRKAVAEARKSEFKKFFCVDFTANQGNQELVKSSRDWKICPKFPEIEPKLVKSTLPVRRSPLLFQS